jgi:acetoacetyl-CoA synthetase
MPLTFWGEDGDDRYRAAYFDRFPGVWTHGDYARWTEHGGMVILGRSDATLNAGGVRIGTAEIYRVVEQFPEVAEGVAVSQRLGAVHGHVKVLAGGQEMSSRW